MQDDTVLEEISQKAQTMMRLAQDIAQARRFRLQQEAMSASQESNIRWQQYRMEIDTAKSYITNASKPSWWMAASDDDVARMISYVEKYRGHDPMIDEAYERVHREVHQRYQVNLDEPHAHGAHTTVSDDVLVDADKRTVIEPAKTAVEIRQELHDLDSRLAQPVAQATQTLATIEQTWANDALSAPIKNTLTRQLTGTLSIVTDESEKTMLQERLNSSTLPDEVKETLSQVIESARTLEEARAQLARAQRETNDANARLDQMLHLESAARDEETLARQQSEHTDLEASLGLASQEEKDAMRTRADMATTAAQDATGDVGDARAQASHATTREAQAQAHYVGTAQTQTSVRITKESFPTSALKGLRARFGKKTTVSATPRPRPRTQSTGRSR